MAPTCARRIASGRRSKLSARHACTAFASAWLKSCGMLVPVSSRALSRLRCDLGQRAGEDWRRDAVARLHPVGEREGGVHFVLRSKGKHGVVGGLAQVPWLAV